MKIYIVALLVGVVGVATVASAPAQATVREQKDVEREEGIDRIRMKLNNLQASEAGNKDRNYQAQETTVDMRAGVHGKAGHGGKGGGSSDGGSNDDEDDASSSSSGGSGSSRRRSNDDDADAEESGSGGGSSSSGRKHSGSGGGDKKGAKMSGTAFIQKKMGDKKIFDHTVEGTARAALQDEIDYAKDSYRKKDKSSHKKEEIYNTKK